MCVRACVCDKCEMANVANVVCQMKTVATVA